MTPPPHIFVVGSGRSGTTLMRHILSGHEDVSICGETRYLRTGHLTRRGFRDRFARVGNLATDEGARSVVDHIYEDIEGKNWWRWIQRNVPREQFLRGLLASDRTDRALFDLVMTLSAQGKPIRGEKTPAHVYCVPTLLEWFPEAKTVHMLRDPRAVFVSRRRKLAAGQWHLHPFSSVRRREPILSLHLSLMAITSWRDIARLHQGYRQTYPENYRLVRFEDLVSDPRAQVMGLCDFLELKFSDKMLDQRVYISSFAEAGTRVDGFNPATIERWRTHLHPWINRLFVATCRDKLLEFGYQP